MKPPLLWFKEWLDTGLRFVYPEVCQICKHEPATPADGFVCVGCARKARFIEPPFCDRCGLPYQGDITVAFECENCREMELHFSRARSAVSANELVLEIIHRYKYQRAMWFEPFLAGLLIRASAQSLAVQKFNLLVPVPLHPAKRREREFNQAERLADCLGRSVGIKVDSKILKRTRPTQTQTCLSRQERAANVRNAFALRGRPDLAGARIVVLDDVFTTGATTSACARVLLAAGADEVCVWTVARGL